MDDALALVGRDADVVAVVGHLSNTGRCSLVGPGGVGKSALAGAVARATSRRSVFVSAEAFDTVADLAAAVARALDGEVLPGEAPLDAAAATFERRDCLVVIDGMEHLGDAGEQLVGRLQTAPDGPWLLLTTRRSPAPPPTHLVAPLPVDGAAIVLLDRWLEALGEPPGVLSPEQRASLAERSGGLPLAIGLAARRVAYGGAFDADIGEVSGSAVIAELDPHMQASVERSLALLDDVAGVAFLTLGLTASAASAEFVGGLMGTEAVDARRAVNDLRRIGLVSGRDGRVDMLPPVRDTALAMLRRAPDGAATLDRAVAFAIDLGRRAWESPTTAALVGDHLESLLHIGWLAVADGHHRALDLADALFEPFHDRMRNAEVLALLSAALDHPDHIAEHDPLLEADAARRAAICASECVSIHAAETLLDRAESAAQRAGSPPGSVARIWSIRAAIAKDAGRLVEAERAAARSVEVGRTADDATFFVWQSTHELALIALQRGDLDTVEALATDCVRWGRVHSSFIANLGAIELAWASFERGRWADAAAHARQLQHDLSRLVDVQSEIAGEARVIEALGDQMVASALPADDRGQAWWLRLTSRAHLAGLVPMEHCWSDALRSAADVAALADSSSLVYPSVVARLVLGDAALAGGELRQAHQAYERALRDAVRSGFRLRAADALDGFAVLADTIGDREVARRAAGSAVEIRRTCGAHPWPRPSLTARRGPVSAPPAGWLVDAMPTRSAVDEIVAAVAARAADPVGSDPVLQRLTRSEREVALLAASGASNNEIAAALFISRRTAESHLQRIYRKLDVRSRSQLAALLSR